jgi:hypothetical protein
MRPHQGIGMLIRRHRRYRSHPDHGPGGRPPDNLICSHHAAPSSSANSVARSHGFIGADGLGHVNSP